MMDYGGFYIGGLALRHIYRLRVSMRTALKANTSTPSK